MAQNFHGGDFQTDSRQVFAQLSLVHNFDCNLPEIKIKKSKLMCCKTCLISCSYVRGKLDLGKAPGAHGLVEFILALQDGVARRSCFWHFNVFMYTAT